MNDKIFVDSNIWLYLFDADDIKKNIVKKLLRENYHISTQVLSENASVCLKKLRLSDETVNVHISNLITSCQVVLIKPSTVQHALKIKENHKLSFYDSQILASAIENKCSILFSEDLGEGATYEGKIKIVNPFKTQS
jgi:predicted nucleic acid-binding protein